MFWAVPRIRMSDPDPVRKRFGSAILAVFNSEQVHCTIYNTFLICPRKYKNILINCWRLCGANYCSVRIKLCHKMREGRQKTTFLGIGWGDIFYSGILTYFSKIYFVFRNIMLQIICLIQPCCFVILYIFLTKLISRRFFQQNFPPNSPTFRFREIF